MFAPDELIAISPKVIKQAYGQLGWEFFIGKPGKPFDLNLFGIRTDNDMLGEFDDYLGAVFLNPAGAWELRLYAATTDPGQFYAKNLMNVAGVAILKAGEQFRGAWTLGKHRGKYEALVQSKPVGVHRDSDLNSIRDESAPVHVGNYGINIHRASGTKEVAIVGKYSAGCQVVHDPEDYKDWMRMLNRASDIWGPSFSYGIIPESVIRGNL